MESITATLYSQSIKLKDKGNYIYDISVSGYSNYDDDVNYTSYIDISCYISNVHKFLYDEAGDFEEIDNPEIIEEIESNLDIKDILNSYGA